MQLGNITSKVEGLFYNNAEIIGVGAGVLSYGLDAMLENIKSIASGDAGMPDIEITLREFIDPKESAGAKNFQAIQWWIGGFLLKEFGIGGRLGGAVQDVAKGFIIGNGIQHVLHSAVHNHT
jgi:hypothetical protein